MILPDYPFRVEFEINSVCNLDCVYCYAKPFTHRTPSIEDLKFLFKKTHEEANPFEVVLLGGEPFMRKDIIEVIEEATKIFEHGIGISTNGTMLNRLSEEQLSRLRTAVYDGSSLQVSLDSLNPLINNQTRGGGDATMKGLDVLESHTIPFSVGIVLTTINQDDVLQTVKSLLLKYRYLKMLNLEPLRPAASLDLDRYLRLRLNSKKMIEIYEGAKRLVTELNRNDVSIRGVLVDRSDIKDGKAPLLDTYDFRTCTAGLLRAGVLADGTVTPCVTIRNIKLGNLYFESWKEIWDRSKKRFLQLGEIGGQCVMNLLKDGNKKR